MVVLFALIGLGFVGTVVNLQTAEAERLETWGEAKRNRSRALPGYRGRVTDRDGFVLAASTPTLQLIADPANVKDPAATADLLAGPLGADRDELIAAMTPSSPDDRYGLLAAEVDDQIVPIVADLLDSEDHQERLAGITLRPTEDRVYPAGELARSVVGRVDPDEQGIYGIEWQLDEYLAGHAGVERYENGIFGRITGGEWNIEAAEQGADVALTIDHRIQYVVEDALARHCTEMGARSANAVVSDPRTGEVLAMATVRRQDSGQCEVAIYNAPMVDTFEPGSVLKAVTAAAAINELGYTSETAIPVPPDLEVGDKVFSDHPRHPAADFSIDQILRDSMNVGAIRLAQNVGSERLYAYLRHFGFGSESGIGFKDEATGWVPDVWHGSEHGSIPIGQGITVNSLQLANAYNAIANDGVLVSPRLIRSITAEDGSQYEMPAQESRAVVSPATAREMVKMLTNVVSSGTGSAAAISDYAVAGKTGTAWKVFADGPYKGTYGDDGARNYVVTFAGFLPAENPQLSIVVVVDEPTVETTAAKVAAPVFAELAHYAVRILGIPPSGGANESEELLRGSPALSPAEEAALAAAAAPVVETSDPPPEAESADPDQADQADGGGEQDPTGDAPDPSTDAAAPTGDPAEPTGDAAEPTGDAAESNTDAAEPTGDEVESSTDAAESGEESATDQDQAALAATSGADQ